MAVVKPMLAHSKTPDLATLTYPLIVQPKFDGIRALIVDGVVQSRSGKPIRNAEIQAALGRPEFNGLDGELLVGSPTANDAMQRTSEFVMSESKTGADWAFYAFDIFDMMVDELVSPDPADTTCISRGATYQERQAALSNRFERGWAWPNRAIPVESVLVHSAAEVNEAEERFVAEGYEGAILRDPRAPYKHGRSGKTGPLLKVKRFTDSEAEIVGVNELMRNGNEAKKDAFGRTERSTAKAGLIPAGTLGNIIARTPSGVVFEIGTGYTAADRNRLWNMRERLPGQLVKYKHFEVGVKDAPRFPVFIGLRDRDDT